MEGDTYHNPHNSVVVDFNGQLNPSNETPAEKPYNEFPCGPKLPSKPLDVWIEKMNYSDKSQREYTTILITE